MKKQNVQNGGESIQEALLPSQSPGQDVQGGGYGSQTQEKTEEDILNEIQVELELFYMLIMTPNIPDRVLNSIASGLSASATTVYYTSFLYNFIVALIPNDPNDPDRDRYEIAHHPAAVASVFSVPFVAGTLWGAYKNFMASIDPGVKKAAQHYAQWNMDAIRGELTQNPFQGEATIEALEEHLKQCPIKLSDEMMARIAERLGKKEPQAQMEEGASIRKEILDSTIENQERWSPTWAIRNLSSLADIGTLLGAVPSAVNRVALMIGAATGEVGGSKLVKKLENTSAIERQIVTAGHLKQNQLDGTLPLGSPQKPSFSPTEVHLAMKEAEQVLGKKAFDSYKDARIAELSKQSYELVSM